MSPTNRGNGKGSIKKRRSLVMWEHLPDGEREVMKVVEAGKEVATYKLEK